MATKPRSAATAVTPIEPLIAHLDPKRDYGDLTFDQVVAGIQSGRYQISVGGRLPVLRDATTGRSIKGSGQPPQTGVSVQQAALREFRELAADDMQEAYDLLMTGMRQGDPRWAKIYWENLLGKMGESKGGDAMVEAFRVFVDAMKTPEVRTVILDQ